MAKTQKRLTKRERKEQFGKGPTGTAPTTEQHIHCISCGRHIDPSELSRALPSATWLTCEHGSRFASCNGCTADSQARLDEHDRSGNPPRVTAAWH